MKQRLGTPQILDNLPHAWVVHFARRLAQSVLMNPTITCILLSLTPQLLVRVCLHVLFLVRTSNVKWHYQSPSNLTDFHGRVFQFFCSNQESRTYRDNCRGLFPVFKLTVQFDVYFAAVFTSPFKVLKNTTIHLKSCQIV